LIIYSIQNEKIRRRFCSRIDLKNKCYCAEVATLIGRFNRAGLAFSKFFPKTHHFLKNGVFLMFIYSCQAKLFNFITNDFLKNSGS
jgi:hypothetical protein